MKYLKHSHDQLTIKREIGTDFSFLQKIRLKGCGSSKVAYLKGIPHFDKLSEMNSSISYVNFQLYPNGLVLRLSKSNSDLACTLHKKEIEEIYFTSRKIEVNTRKGVKIVFDATLEINLIEHQHICFYIPQTFYSPMKDFFRKNWLLHCTTFSFASEKPTNDKGSSIANTLFRLAENFL